MQGLSSKVAEEDAIRNVRNQLMPQISVPRVRFALPACSFNWHRSLPDGTTTMHFAAEHGNQDS